MNKTNTSIVALAIFSTIGGALPALAFVGNGHATKEPHRLWADAIASVEAPVVDTLEPETPATDEVRLAPVVIQASAPQPKRAAPEATVRCTSRPTELQRGSVRICDVARTQTAKPTRLAARDLPSPSGLLR